MHIGKHGKYLKPISSHYLISLFLIYQYNLTITINAVQTHTNIIGNFCSWTLRLMDNAAYGHCGSWTLRLWTMRLIDNAAEGHCGLWTMRLMDTAAHGHCGLWTMRLMDNAAHGHCGLWTMRLMDTTDHGNIGY